MSLIDKVVDSVGTTEVIKFPSPKVAAFRKGERDFHAGRPCGKPRPDDDDPCTSIDAAEYLGWMVARGTKMMAEMHERERVMRLLEVDPDRPA